MENNEIKENLKYLESITKLDDYVDGEKNTKKGIIAYYIVNKIAYRIFHSKEGFMHFRISKDEVCKDEDILYQLYEIEKFFKPNFNVLELGFGQASNLYFLANRNSNVNFTGVDLCPGNKKNIFHNVKLIKLDYHDLSRFEDNSFDVVYAIETLVHSSNKEKIFKQVNRILKPNGVFIVYDYATIKEFKEMTDEEKLTITLISKGGSSSLIESLDVLKDKFSKAGFKQTKLNDLTKFTLPDLKRLKNKANKILKHKVMSKIIFRIFPKRFLGNIIVGFLGYDACKSNLGYYMEFIYNKSDEI